MLGKLRARLKSAKSKSSRPHGDDASVAVAYTRSGFGKLIPVHDTILDALFQLSPATVLCLSRWHHDHYLPQLYRDVVLSERFFAPLLACHRDDAAPHARVVGAYKHTTTLRLYDRRVGSVIRSVVFGTEGNWTTHPNLFDNVTRLVISWEVFTHEASEDRAAWDDRAAGYLGVLLAYKRPSPLRDLVFLWGTRPSPTDRLIEALYSWRECPARRITFVIGGLLRPWPSNLSLPRYSSVNESPDPPHSTPEVLRFVLVGNQEQHEVTPDLMIQHIRDAASHRDAVTRLARLSVAWSRPAPPTTRVEFHVQEVDRWASKLTWEGDEHAERDRSWMEEYVDFCELDMEALDLDMGELWPEHAVGGV
ncbi:hypothetical protein IAU60_006875 [Kwoniella sp. DSM 27419]